MDLGRKLPFPAAWEPLKGGKLEGHATPDATLALERSAPAKLTQLWDYNYGMLCGPAALLFLCFLIAFQISFLVGALMSIGSIGRSLCLLFVYVVGLVELA